MKIRTDCGKEFCNKDVKKFLLSKGIKHGLTTPRAPEQNGYIERQNRTIVESAKSMLHARKLPLYLWAEATAVAVYVKNRTATNTLNGKTPYEMWFEEKPSVSHLKIFGSTCYVHIPKDQRSKWEMNSTKMMMIGYSDGNKAYKVYDPALRKCYVRRDVVFDGRPFSDEVVIVGNDKNDVDDMKQGISEYTDELRESLKRNPRAPIPRDPYSFRPRIPYTTDLVESKIAETLFTTCEPQTLREAVDAEDAVEWIRAMHDELNLLEENKTWELVKRPENQNVISNRWIFKTKYTADGEVEKYKARLVIRGFSQKEGIDYKEIFAPVVKYNTVKTVLSMVAVDDLEMIQFDVKTAFLYGDLEETIFMEQPFGFEVDDRVCMLKKSLYGLKQAPRQWNKKINKFFLDYGLIQSKSDPCLYYMIIDNVKLYVILYVDDGIICSNNTAKMNDSLSKLSGVFKIKISEAEFFVGMQIKRDRKLRFLKMFQTAYTKRILSKFNHENCMSLSIPADPSIKFLKVDESNSVKHNFPYREVIGSLMFLMVATRPDLAYIVSVLSQFSEMPDESHWNGVKRIFRYLKGTIDHGIDFDQFQDNNLVA